MYFIGPMNIAVRYVSPGAAADTVTFTFIPHTPLENMELYTDDTAQSSIKITPCIRLASPFRAFQTQQCISGNGKTTNTLRVLFLYCESFPSHHISLVNGDLMTYFTTFTLDRSGSCSVSTVVYGSLRCLDQPFPVP